jgi:hypothetical protein
MRTFPCGRLVAGVVLTLVLASPGCDSKEAAARAKRTNQLTAVGIAYHRCIVVTGKGPADADELGKSLVDAAEALAAVKAGEIVVIWNARIPADCPDGTSHTVLAYEKDAPARGGVVLLCDTATQVMTAQEFGAKAKPTLR